MKRLQVFPINIDLFKVDPNEIKIKSKEIDLKLRNNLKDYLNEKMSNIISQFKAVLSNYTKAEFLKVLEELRLITRYS